MSLHPDVPRYSDEDLAIRFAEAHRDSLRYCAALGQWFVWDGSRWSPDQRLQVTHLVRQFCRGASAEPAAGSRAHALARLRTSSAVEQLARSDVRLVATVDQWDPDPLLLNTPDGIVNLRTGQMLPADPARYMTKSTSVGPAGTCPGWHAFLGRITGGSAALQAFLQRAMGYALTGLTSEQVLFFAFGTGANGKSVFIETIGGVLGDYHKTSPMGTFEESPFGRHSTELARLQGARLVTAVETDEGRRWAEARIKSLTGGDPITARFMRQDFFTYHPQFKLLIAGNHKPSLRAVDEAIRRRLHLIPFLVTIPPEERDPELKTKLREEWPGILSWLIQGCLEFRRLGLDPPPEVVEATTEYLEGEDEFGAWIGEFCVQDPQATETSSRLWNSWKQYAEKAGEAPGSQKTFTQRLEARRFVRMRTSHFRGFRGIRLRYDD